MTTKWRLVTWKDFAIRSHIVCEELEPLLIAEMTARAPEYAIEKVEDHVSDGINMPGMIITTRPNETFDFDGLELEIPCEDVVSFVSKLKHQAVRHFGRVPYYKLHSFLRCTVLTPGQRDRLIALLEERAVVAEQKADAFYESRRRV